MSDQRTYDGMTFAEKMAESGYSQGDKDETAEPIRDVRVPEQREVEPEPVRVNADESRQREGGDSQTAVAPAENTAEQLRKRALAKAIGLDKATPEQRELALAWASRYGLDLLLRHIVLIEGKPFITRDGLLHVAHRSERLNGISVTGHPEVVSYLDGDYWTAEVTVWRNDMSQPFAFPGRHPVKHRDRHGNLVVTQYGPEMAIKAAESMALRRAFDVAAPVAEERVDSPAEDEDAGDGMGYGD